MSGMVQQKPLCIEDADPAGEIATVPSQRDDWGVPRVKTLFRAIRTDKYTILSREGWRRWSSATWLWHVVARYKGLSIEHPSRSCCASAGQRATLSGCQYISDDQIGYLPLFWRPG